MVLESDASPQHDQFSATWWMASLLSSEHRQLRDELDACRALSRRIMGVKFTAVEFAARGQADRSPCDLDRSRLLSSPSPSHTTSPVISPDLRRRASRRRRPRSAPSTRTGSACAPLPRARSRRRAAAARHPVPPAPARLGRASPSMRARSLSLPPYRRKCMSARPHTSHPHPRPASRSPEHPPAPSQGARAARQGDGGVPEGAAR